MTRLLNPVAWLLCAAALSQPGWARDAAAPKMVPGTYISVGHWGALTITEQGRATRFEIDAIGTNCHTCNLSGMVTAGIGVVEDDSVGDPAQACKVSFKACQATLATTRAGAEGEADFSLPPCDHDNYIAVAKATWHNQRLCSQAPTAQ